MGTGAHSVHAERLAGTPPQGLVMGGSAWPTGSSQEGKQGRPHRKQAPQETGLMVRQALLPACQPANCPSSYSTGSAAVQVSSPRFLPACPGTPLCPIVSGVCPGTGVKVRSAPPSPRCGSEGAGWARGCPQRDWHGQWLPPAFPFDHLRPPAAPPSHTSEPVFEAQKLRAGQCDDEHRVRQLTNERRNSDPTHRLRSSASASDPSMGEGGALPPPVRPAIRASEAQEPAAESPGGMSSVSGAWWEGGRERRGGHCKTC